MKQVAYESCKKSIAQRLGCQSRCPGCGAKCSKPEPHETETVEGWREPCQCPPDNCICKTPETVTIVTHESTHHIAQAFFGRRYHKSKTPTLELCYQRWTNGGMWVPKDPQTSRSKIDGKRDDLNEDEDYTLVHPNAKYYSERYPAWYNDLKRQSTEGNACNETIPPPDQRRAWMVVRRALVKYYCTRGMIDRTDYDPNLYPAGIVPIDENFKPGWKDRNFE
ncbi:unnamed protein product [Rotaria sp. Silwood1]|nr:unnamed protein product [Rotaria sp. Silwood1]CAF1651038.1 unnamed protein product [Rotaria sp. Silwood1]CAF3827035.1 unnamed protein product [Rotaria sp. Silwood1]CAF3873636.1 unnamed protein product [Rotaria sp. Silwood1]CAF4960281.1 unnamed protein product [Rotaria sp. Silwood1]